MINHELDKVENIIEVARSRNLKDRQCNGQKKKGKRTNNDLQLKDRQCNGQKKKGKRTNNDLQNSAQKTKPHKNSTYHFLCIL